MLEIGADMEMKAKSSELIENTEAELPDISFEELLAQEKKDAFWSVLPSLHQLLLPLSLSSPTFHFVDTAN